MSHFSVAFAEEVLELDWEALVPRGWTPDNLFDAIPQDKLDLLTDSSPEALKLMEQMEEARNSAPVVAELNDKLVRLPGFVVPLEFDGDSVSEFLLVPYFGACIHVPPPPSNQIVYVKSEESVQVEGLFSAVYVTGRLKTVSISSDLADAGYTLEAIEVTPYQ
jgi:hypothetical protein